MKLGRQQPTQKSDGMGQFISIDSGSFSIHPEEGPCRGFLCDCETSNFTFPSLVWTELSRGPDGWHHTGRPGLGWTAFFTRKPGCQPRCPAQPSTLHHPPARALTGTLAAQAHEYDVKQWSLSEILLMLSLISSLHTQMSWEQVPGGDCQELHQFVFHLVSGPI